MYLAAIVDREGDVVATKGAMRTVTFFRLIAMKADGPVSFPHKNWQKVLGQVVEMELLQRTYEGPTRRLIGEVLVVDGDYALKLMEPRDENSWLEILAKSGSASPVDEDTLGTLVETSVVAFLDEKNLFGIIRGSNSSPTHTAVAEWLDHLELGGKRIVATPGAHLSAEPALSSRQRKKLEVSDGVSSASMRISTSQSKALEEAGSELVGGTLRKLRKTYGDLVVTVTIRVPRGKAHDQARQLLKEETKRWESVREKADAVKATLVHYDAEAKAHAEEVNFISQRIAIQKGVPLTDEQGQPIRNDSAVRAITSAAYEMRDEIASVE